MRNLSAIFVVAVGVFSQLAIAQSENMDPPTDGPTAVMVTQPPATKLDAMDRQLGLVVKGLTQVADVTDDRGGSLTVYAVTMDDQKTKLRGLALVANQTGNRSARAYLDYDDIVPLIDNLKTLAKLDRGATALTDSRGVYRPNDNMVFLNIDDNNGRTAIVRTVQYSPLTGQVATAAVRFRAVRLNEIIRQLETAKATLDKVTK